MSALDLECTVCFEPYDARDREPKVLPCGGAHELCGSCLKQLRPVGDEAFLCPECREPIPPGARINTNRGLLAALSLQPLAKKPPVGDAPPRQPAALTQPVAPSSTQGSLCSQCEKRLPRDAFSGTMLKKSAAVRRCKACVAIPAVDVDEPTTSAKPPAKAKPCVAPSPPAAPVFVFGASRGGGDASPPPVAANSVAAAPGTFAFAPALPTVSPPSTPTPTEQGALVGKAVVIFGVTSSTRQDLNFAGGVATAWDATAGRYRVRLDRTGEMVALRPACLTAQWPGAMAQAPTMASPFKFAAPLPQATPSPSASTRSSATAPRAALPTKREIQSTKEPRLLLEMLRNHGPHSREVAKQICTAINCANAEHAAESVDSVAMAAALLACIHAHSGSDMVLSVCMLLSRFVRPADAHALGLTRDLCLDLLLHVRMVEAAAKDAEDADSSIACLVGTFACGALVGIVYDEEGDEYEPGLVALREAGGIKLVVRILRAYDAVFGDSLPPQPTGLASLLSAAKANGTRPSSKDLMKHLPSSGKATGKAGGMELLMFKTSLNNSLKLIASLAWSDEGALAFVRAGGLDAVNSAFDNYPEDPQVEDHWKRSIAALTRHEQNEALTAAMAAGLAEGAKRPWATRFVSLLVQDESFRDDYSKHEVEEMCVRLHADALERGCANTPRSSSQASTKSVAGKSVAGKSAAGKWVAGKSAAGKSVADKPVAGKDAALRQQAALRQARFLNSSPWCGEAACPAIVRQEFPVGQTPLATLRKVEAGGKFGEMRRSRGAGPKHMVIEELETRCLTCGLSPPEGEAWQPCAHCGIAHYCCAEHAAVGWNARGHAETCGWPMPCKFEIHAMGELTASSVIRLLAQLGPASAFVAYSALHTVVDICGGDAGFELSPTSGLIENPMFLQFARDERFGGSLVHVMDSFTKDCALQGYACQMIVNLGLANQLKHVAKAGAIPALVRALRLAHAYDWSMSEMGRSDESGLSDGDCRLPSVVCNALMQFCDRHVADSDVHSVIKQGAPSLLVAAITRAVIRRSEDDEELAGLAMMVLLQLAMHGATSVASTRHDTIEILPVHARDLAGFDAVRGAGGVQAAIAAMRAFPPLTVNVGEFLQNIISIDPMDESIVEAKYNAGEPCLYTDINEAAGMDAKKVMHAIHHHGSMPSWTPPRYQAKSHADGGCAQQ